MSVLLEDPPLHVRWAEEAGPMTWKDPGPQPPPLLEPLLDVETRARLAEIEAYDAGPPPAAYVEPIAVGDDLPDMPLFLKPDFYIPAPLEASYQTTWIDFPAELKGLLETPTGNPPENS